MQPDTKPDPHLKRYEISVITCHSVLSVGSTQVFFQCGRDAPRLDAPDADL